jgi:RND family efflux transporter MFP subunit
VSLTEVSTISPAQSLVLVTSTGYVVPQSWSKVGAKIPGRLAQVLVKEGDTVKAGDVIATLDDADQKSAIAAAQSRVSVARARAATARANRAEIRVQVDRTRALVDNGALGRAQLEDLEAREKALEEAVKAADAEALAVQAEVESLRILLRDRVVVAPINGTVIAKPAAAGETVGPQLTGIANVAEIADFGSIVVETDVPEARLDLIKLDGPAEIVLDAYPNRRYRGVTGDIGRRVNRAKATVVVKVKFKDTLDDVLPDMQARVSFLSAELAAESLVEAPKKVVAASAIVERDGRKAVWTVESGRLHLVYVSVGAPVGTSVELAEGPVAGTRVVSAPARDLFEGQRIKEPEAQ